MKENTIDSLNKSEKEDSSLSLKEIKSFLKNLKDYLPLIIFFPTILGGLWQVMVLGNFGLSYIRFFSFSQLVSDGLIILFYLPFIIFITFIIVKEFGYKEFIKKYIYIKTLIQLLLFYCILFSIVKFEGENPSLIYNIPILEFSLASINFAIALLFFKKATYFGKRQKSINSLTSRFFYKKKIRIHLLIKFKLKEFFYFNFFVATFLSFFIGFLLYFFITLNTIFSIGNYKIPDNLYNTKVVSKYLEEDYGIKKEDFNINYFNDTYIFVKHYTVNKEKRDSLFKENKTIPAEIIILKSEKFFKE